MFVCQYVIMTCLLRKLLMHSIFSCLHKSSPVIPELSTMTRPAVCSDYCSTERGGVNWSDQKRGLEERNRKKSNDHMTEWGIMQTRSERMRFGEDVEEWCHYRCLWNSLKTETWCNRKTQISTRGKPHVTVETDGESVIAFWHLQNYVLHPLCVESNSLNRTQILDG